MRDAVVYNGRLVPRERFRTFIYHAEGNKKLVESYSEFEEHLKTGVWFSTKEAISKIKVKAKGKGGA